jgi:Uncharacterized protein conserved in bacteria
MANHESLQKLYIDELRDLFSAEQMILEALPQMEKKASHPRLKAGFRSHAEQTQRHTERLQRIFSTLGTKPTGEQCKGMKGIIDEGKEVLKKYHDSDVLDAAMIASAQRVEHYEIAGYGSVRTYANMLGLADQENLLQQTLDEEGNMDHQLTKIAEEVVNVEALKAR